jgi:hypothetical protein
MKWLLDSHHFTQVVQITKKCTIWSRPNQCSSQMPKSMELLCQKNAKISLASACKRILKTDLDQSMVLTKFYPIHGIRVLTKLNLKIKRLLLNLSQSYPKMLLMSPTSIQCSLTMKPCILYSLKALLERSKMQVINSRVSITFEQNNRQNQV